MIVMDNATLISITHDMRNYLSAVLASLQALQAAPNAPDRMDTIADAIAGARHLAVAISRIDGMGDPPPEEPPS